MKAGNQTRLPLLPLLAAILLCALALGGCGDGGQSQSQAQTDAVKKAEAELTAAQLKLTEVETEAKRIAGQLTTAADKEREAGDKARDFRAKTEAQGKDPNDERESPNTFAAIKAHGEAERTLEDARAADVKAKANVQDAKNKVDEAAIRLEAARNPPADLLPDWLLYALAGVVGLAALGGIGYLLYKRMSDSRAQAQQASAAAAVGRQQRAALLDSSLAALSKKADEHFTRLTDEIGVVNARVGKLRDEVAELRRLLGPTPSPQFAPNAYQGQVVEAREPPAFPVSAVEYLNRVGRSAVGVKSDSLNEMLVRAAEGEMMLVDNSSSPVGQPHVFPAVGSFKTKQEFYSYYEKYFDCDRPAGGEVWIIRPALVNPVNGGWELRERGELEVR